MTHRGRWITPAALRLLTSQLRSRGYVAVSADPQTPEHASLLVRLGFALQPGGYFLPLYET